MIMRKSGRRQNVKIFVLLSFAGVLLFSAFPVQAELSEEQKARQMLESIMKSAPSGIGVVVDRMIVQVNDYILDLTGYSQEELLGQNARMLYPTQEESDYVGREKYRQISEKGTGSVETRWLCKDGSIRHVILSSTPLDPSDLSAGVTFTVLDITDRKKAEAALVDRTRLFLAAAGLSCLVLIYLLIRLATSLKRQRESAEELESFFMVNLDLLCISDMKGNFVKTNEAWSTILGYSTEELNKMNFLEFVHPDDRQNTMEAMADLGKGAEVLNFTNRYRCQDGSYRYIEWRSRPKGNVIYAAARDITERKQADEAIELAHKQLESKNKELEQLIYVASHDLRSPLVNVDGFSRELDYSLQNINHLLLLGKDTPELEQTLRTELPDMNQSIAHIRNSVVQMDRLLKGLLKLSRAGRAALRMENLNMNELMDLLVSTFAFRLREAGVTLTVEHLPPCQGDAVQVIQVFSNLVDNAIKYLDKKRPGVIKITGTLEAERALYRVEDNGIGIAVSSRERIFELFYRLNPKETEGEGLGLTMTQQALRRINGDITMESKPGSGSTFIVSLPVVNQQGQWQAQPLQEAHP